MPENKSFAFIVGSPRSGTTLLGDILDKHPKISQWYEPYFVWDKFFRNASHDERTQEDATYQVSQQIYNDFLRYKKKTKSSIIVDKSPRNSLKIPFILKIFPQAYFIHILRDGRDVTLSIHKEWIRRKRIIHRNNNTYEFDYKNATVVIKKWLKRQKFISDKFRALWFETRAHLIDKTKQLHRQRWFGQVGWGPRFKGWEGYLNTHSILEFNAMQWVKSVEGVDRIWPYIADENKIKIKYEDLLRFPKETLNNVLNTLKVKTTNIFFARLPELKKDNIDKWKIEFTDEDLREIRPIISPLISKFGYTNSNEW
jgi:hypothetical protein